jgi:glycosyltransferase involved in cell wall biosynthesis
VTVDLESAQFPAQYGRQPLTPGTQDMPPVTHPASVEIIVPARNEEHRLPGGLRALCDKAATLPLRTAIIVVDSASTDATSDVVRAWPPGPVPVGLLRCDRPGKGAAVREGLLATRAPFVGFCDADMATELSALDDAISLLVAGHALVIGSRALSTSVVEARSSAVRAAGASLFRTMARWTVPGAADTQCGFKFFSGPLARRAALSLRTAGFAFDVELLANCLRGGTTLTEIPVSWRDIAGSTFSVRRHSVVAFRDLVSIFLRSRVLRGVSAPPPALAPPAPLLPGWPLLPEWQEPAAGAAET